MTSTAPAEIPANVRVWRLTHRTDYRYTEDVATSYGRAHLIPRHGDGQHRIQTRVQVCPEAAELREHTDYYANRSVYFVVREPHRRLAVTATSLVAVEARTPDREALRDARAHQVIQRLADSTELDPGLLGAREFLLPSPMIAPAPEIATFAAGLVRPGRSIDEVLVDLLDRFHHQFTYSSGATTLNTPLVEVLAQREGVCQDFAHLAIAALRCCGLAARYVSGYLETRPPPGQPRLVGADASHAWLSVYVPGTGWVDIDPTNHGFVDDGYVVTAVGRDYGDVPPLRGVIFTESTESTMTVSVDMAPADLADAADFGVIATGEPSTGIPD